jgi:hypothetical protein
LEPSKEGTVADVGGPDLDERRQTMHVMVGPDALDPAHGARSETGTGPVGDAEVHGHTHQGHVEAGEVGLLRRVEPQRSAEQRRDAFVGLRPAIGARKHPVDDRAELGVVRLARRGGPVPGAQVLELLAVHRRSLLASHAAGSRPAKIAAEFPANPPGHIFTRCYPRLPCIFGELHTRRNC